MCGIAGIYQFDNKTPERAELEEMIQTLNHRGPDGQGYWINEQHNVGFGHSRLAIIDKDERSNQPYRFKHLSLTYNGELYNYLEIKKELEGMGYDFQTSGDTEVLICAYDAWGSECLAKFDGMFAFAVFDENKGQLFAARDRFGEKPFFYSLNDKKFVFGSEIKTIAKHLGKLEVRDESVFRYLIYDVVENPSDKKETFYCDVYQIPPSCSLTISSNGDATFNQYWDIKHSTPYNGSIDEASERFRKLFFKSVKRRLRSDVEIGTSLSGGLDSSSIIAGIFHEEVKSMNSFSARFKSQNDEGEFIDILNERYPFARNDIWPDENGLVDNLEKVFYHQEEPFGSSSIFAQWEVMKEAQKKNVTVLLDGQGGDETLGGYHKYLPLSLRETLKRKPQNLFKEISLLKKELNVKLTGKNWLQLISPGLFDKIRNKRISRSNFNHIVRDLHPDFISKRKNVANPFYSFGSLNEALYYDTFSYGLGKLLRFADRNSMAFSREIRLPLLSHEVVEFAFSLPAEMKIKIPWTKYVLRQSMSEFLPEKITRRKDKKGFEPPEEQWMNSDGMKRILKQSLINLQERKVLNKCDNVSSWQVIMASQVYQFADKNSSS